MHLVFLNQYYPPDVAPTGLMLEAVVRRLAAGGHRVTVICSAGGYGLQGGGDMREPTESHPEVVICRVAATRLGRRSHWAKLLDYATFYLGVAWRLLWLRPKPDRIVALTTPPYLSVLARLLSRLRGGDHAHWVMDLYPDVMVAHGMCGAGSAAARVLGRLTTWGFGGTRCAAVVTLGPDMEARVRRYLTESTPVNWVPLWNTACGDGSVAEAIGQPSTAAGGRPMVLMYSGNMGLGHRFGEMLRAATSHGADCRWVFAGRGKRRCEIESFVKDHPEVPIVLGDYVPRSLLAEHLAAADVHLASLEPAWDGTMVPSKIQGIFAAGRPVIFVGSRSSSIGMWITESGGGWVVAPDDDGGFRQALGEARDPEVRCARGQAARRFHDQWFEAERNSDRMSEIFLS